MQPRCAGKRHTPSPIQADSAHDLASAFLVQRWLPAIAQFEGIAASRSPSRLTGSGSVALETTARRDRDGWVLDGAKRWIVNGSIADVVVVCGALAEGRAGQGLPRRARDLWLSGCLARDLAGRHLPRGARRGRLRRGNGVLFENQVIPRYGRHQGHPHLRRQSSLPPMSLDTIITTVDRSRQRRSPATRSTPATHGDPRPALRASAHHCRSVADRAVS